MITLLITLNIHYSTAKNFSKLQKNFSQTKLGLFRGFKVTEHFLGKIFLCLFLKIAIKKGEDSINNCWFPSTDNSADNCGQKLLTNSIRSDSIRLSVYLTTRLILKTSRLQQTFYYFWKLNQHREECF